MRWRGRKTEGAVLVFHVITELRRLEQIRQDFVANVSYKLRTPVTIIKGYAETLLEGALKAIVQHVVSELKKQAQERSITIHNDIPDDLPNILADEGRISQVLLNLLDNAIKYNKEKGSVTISAKEQGDFIHVAVFDTGVGIPGKDLNRIFERFYRVDKACSRELDGTGLGLSIVKHIVQEHNGHVAVDSLIGHGSTFSFMVPKA